MPVSIDPAIVLDAIGTFLSNRLIDELNMAYLNEFRNNLAANTYLNTLLPKTTKFLVAIGQDGKFDYKNLLEALRQVLFEDLVDLSRNAPMILEDNVVKTQLLNANPDIYVLLKSCFEIINSVQDDVAIPEIVSRIGKMNLTQLLNFNGTLYHSDAAVLLELGARISDHLREQGKHGKWIGSNITDYLSTPRGVFLFAGLIYAYEEPFMFSQNIAGRPLNTYIQGSNGQRLTDLVFSGLSLTREVANLIDPPGGTEANQSFDKKLETALSLSERLLGFLANLTEDPSTRLQYSQATQIVRCVLSIKQQIAKKEFVSATSTFFSQIESLCPSLSSRIDTKQVFRYLSFAQNLINATTKEEIVDALEQAAEPVGSYQLKRTHPLTVSITAFPGLYAAREQYVAGVNQDKVLNTFGFTAPLGLAISGRKKANSTLDLDQSVSLTLFLPIIDVGAITAFRLANQGAELSDLKWESFFAPGAFIDIGFKKSPLSLHLGTQYGPGLQKIGGSDRERIWRYGAGLSVDLHLWNIYTKPRA